MEVKEAIKLIKTLKEVLYEAYLIGKVYVGGTEGFERNINDIIALLQQGEKYRLILKDLDRQYGHYLIGVKGNGEIGIGYTIRDFIEKVEQKYFPKEKTDANNNR